jgi:hypothetical protein
MICETLRRLASRDATPCTVAETAPIAIILLLGLGVTSMMTPRRLCFAIFALAISSVPNDYAAAQADACIPGYVWREAFTGDHVCVTPDTSERAKSDNAKAAELRAKTDSGECLQGFVWRLANAEDHVCVPQMTREQTAQDNALAHSRLASGPQAPFAGREAPALPLPPAKVGCYVFKNGAWQEVPCTPEEQVKKLPPPSPTSISIQDQQRTIKLFGDTPFTLPLTRGSISIELESDRALGTVTDVIKPHAVCPNVPDSKDSTRIPNRFSIQLNSNRFTTSYGSMQGGWVQFAYQTGPDLIVQGQTGNQLCVWKFDVNVFDANVKDKAGNRKGYETACVPTEPGVFLGPDATGSAVRPGAVVTGIVNKLPDDPHTYLATLGGFSWAPLTGTSPFPFYAVVTMDELDETNTTVKDLPSSGKKVSLGFRQGWTQATGDLYGAGCESTAEFEGVVVFETLTVSSCNFDLSCLQKPLNVFSLQNFATAVPDPGVTGEGNNLKWMEITTLPGIQYQVFNCPYFEECRNWGRFKSPK